MPYLSIYKLDNMHNITCYNFCLKACLYWTFYQRREEVRLADRDVRAPFLNGGYAEFCNSFQTRSASVTPQAWASQPRWR